MHAQLLHLHAAVTNYTLNGAAEAAKLSLAINVHGVATEGWTAPKANAETFDHALNGSGPPSTPRIRRLGDTLALGTTSQACIWCTAACEVTSCATIATDRRISDGNARQASGA